MPWCEPCARYFAPSALQEDASCPACGEVIDVQTPVNVGKVNLRALASNGEQESTPWHFKLLVGALIVYLTWRVVSIFV